MKKLSSNVVLEVENLSIHFGGLKAVDDLSFSIEEGEIYGLIGPNGAGKTTVFNCITQFYKPTIGNIYVNNNAGETVNLIDFEVHKIIEQGLVRTFQNVELIPSLTLVDNLLTGAHVHYETGIIQQIMRTKKYKAEEEKMREKAEGILEFLGIGHLKDQFAGSQPYGVLKKTEIGRTLMANPKLIILDEPAAGLNETETDKLVELIKIIRDEYNCSVLLVEHDMSLVMSVCDKICAISFGKRLAIGTPNEIKIDKNVQEAYLGTGD